jgi:hypothetical protein
VIGKVTWNEMLSLTLAYAPDYANLDYDSFYANIGGTWELGNEFSLNAGLGHSDFSDDNGSYTDWNIGVSRPFGPVTLALNYYDTDIDFEDGAGPQPRVGPVRAHGFVRQRLSLASPTHAGKSPPSGGLFSLARARSSRWACAQPARIRSSCRRPCRSCRLPSGRSPSGNRRCAPGA